MFSDKIIAIWFALSALSAIYVAWDVFTRTPAMKVMKWGWLLVTLYLGPVSLVVYWFSCRKPIGGNHDRFIAPMWKQGVGSTIHCVAGDATGIVFAAAITAVLRLPMSIDSIVEYLTGFTFGLLIFQALFMKDMMGGSYSVAVKKSALPEWLSMNCVMAGMIPVMVLVMSRDMAAMEPTNGKFWFTMSMATIVGAIIAYPINYWLVVHKLKHGMGTERALGRGGSKVAAASSSGHEKMQQEQQVSTAAKVFAGVISLIVLAAGVWVAALFGDFSMRPMQ